MFSFTENLYCYPNGEAWYSADLIILLLLYDVICKESS